MLQTKCRFRFNAASQPVVCPSISLSVPPYPAVSSQTSLCISRGVTSSKNLHSIPFARARTLSAGKPSFPFAHLPFTGTGDGYAQSPFQGPCRKFPHLHPCGTPAQREIGRMRRRGAGRASGSSFGLAEHPHSSMRFASYVNFYSIFSISPIGSSISNLCLRLLPEKRLHLILAPNPGRRVWAQPRKKVVKIGVNFRQVHLDKWLMVKEAIA